MDYFEDDGGKQAKLFVDQMAAPVPEIMDGSLQLISVWVFVKILAEVVL
jgi:hypothetical protein